MDNKKFKVLNLEDNAIKHSKISRVISSVGANEIIWVRNLEDGLNMIEQSIESGEQYDLIISDMWYPLSPGGSDNDSGEELIKQLATRDIYIPVIICSTIQYNYDDSDNVIAAVQYGERFDWETALRKALETIMQKD